MSEDTEIGGRHYFLKMLDESYAETEQEKHLKENVGLIRWVMARYGRGYPSHYKMEIAILAYVKAYEKWEPEKGTWATFYVSYFRNMVRDPRYHSELYSTLKIHIPPSVKLAQLHAMLEEAGLDIETSPLPEVLEVIGLGGYLALKARDRDKAMMSLDRKRKDDYGNVEYGSGDIEDRNAACSDQDEARVEFWRIAYGHLKKHGHLKNKAEQVFLLRIVDGQTLDVVAQQLKISRERVRQIQSVLVDRLRSCEDLRAYHGSDIFQIRQQYREDLNEEIREAAWFVPDVHAKPMKTIYAGEDGEE